MPRRSSDLGEGERISELGDEGVSQGEVFSGAESWVFGEKCKCVLARLVEHFEFLGNVGHLEFGQAVLAGSEELTGAAELEVHLGDLEAVGGAGHGPESLLGLVGRGVGDQQAGGSVLAAPDAAAELMELREAEAVG